MIRRPPRSTLFPYTTALPISIPIRCGGTPATAQETNRPNGRSPSCAARAGWVRSEEHTSELQSQSNLVCRLLLEKKNNNATDDISSVRHNVQVTLASLRLHYP